VSKPQVRVSLTKHLDGSQYVLRRTADDRLEASNFDSREEAENWATEHDYPLCFHRWTIAPDGEHECSKETTR
jgi:hypothetical protein